MLRGARAATNATRATNATNARARAPSRSAYDVARTFVARVDAGAGERGATVALSDALRAHLPSEYASATSAKREIRRKNVLVNGTVRSVGDAVADGDVVEVLARIRPSSPVAAAHRAGERAVALARDDPHFAIMVKPDDCVSVGKGSDPMKWSAERLCATALTPTPEGVEGALSRPRPVHRLDELTGGLLVCAKTRMAMTALSAAFEKREVRKRYRAVLRGRVESKTGVVDVPLGGLESLTEYSVVREYESEEYGGILTLIDFFPKTGRTHQLRRHAKALCAPILGDVKYDYASRAHEDGLFLWATGIVLPPSATPWRGEDCGELIVDIEEGEKFARVLARCQELA